MNATAASSAPTSSEAEKAEALRIGRIEFASAGAVRKR